MGTAMLIGFVGLVLARGRAKNVLSSSSLAIVVCCTSLSGYRDSSLDNRMDDLPSIAFSSQRYADYGARG